MNFNRLSVSDTGSSLQGFGCIGPVLEHTVLFAIQNTSFIGLKSLRHMNLQCNSIASITPLSLGHLTSLLFLDLGENRLTTVTAGMFTGLINLTWLHLGNNQISQIEEGALDTLISLQTLHLQNNKIVMIHGNFGTLYNLKYLDLENNRISHIEPGSFDSLFTLHRLQLDLWNVSTLDPNTFTNLPQKSAFRWIRWQRRIAQLNCSSLCWLKAEEQHGKVSLYGEQRYKCANQQPWSSFQCDYGE